MCCSCGKPILVRLISKKANCAYILSKGRICYMSKKDIPAHFPFETIREEQKEMFDFFDNRNETQIVVEAPTGSGKTAVGYTWLKQKLDMGISPCYYLVPNKTIAMQVYNQIKQWEPDVHIAYGRNEFQCLYYLPDQQFTAEEVPCSMLTSCAHRVNLENGAVHIPGSDACPYYAMRLRVRNMNLIICTYAFYRFAVQFNKNERPAGAMVVDEVHGLAQALRSMHSWTISVKVVQRAIDTFSKAGFNDAVVQLQQFQKELITCVQYNRNIKQRLLHDKELETLLHIIEGIDVVKITDAVNSMVSKPDHDVELIKTLERLIHDITRYLRMLKYALPDEDHGRLYALNYMYSCVEGNGVGGKLILEAYNVKPLIRSMLPAHALCMSATIGNDWAFTAETGIKAPLCRIGSHFPITNRKVYMPVDTPYLSRKKRPPKQPGKILEELAQRTHELAGEGHRSLVLLTSERERISFNEYAEAFGVDLVSYESTQKAKLVASEFREGKGSVLSGTMAQYGEGADFPQGAASFIFILRPGYPNPHDAVVKFEDKRYGRNKWAIWQWRVILKALQACGRNIRTEEDKGVAIFISQQFNGFLWGALPEWLKPAFVQGKTLNECTIEGM